MRWVTFVGTLALTGWLAAEPAPAQAQGGTVTGVVTTEAERPVAGARVSIQGTQRAATTGANGRFTLTGVPAGTHTLTASAPGYGIQLAEGVAVTAGQTRVVNFELTAEDALQLEGIVAVGYGTQRKRDVTGAIGSVRTEELEKVQVPTVAQALQGRVAGVQVTQNSSAPGGGVSLRIRGSGSIGTTNEPLYVVDGIPISGGDNNDPTGGRPSSVNPLAFLNPEDIESIEVLKDASSTAIYGARGTNGVVLISTKKGKPGMSRIEFESSLAAQQATNKFPVLNGRQFAQMANDWARLEGLDRVPYPNLDAIGPGIDYQDEVLRSNAPMMEHNVSVLGGTDQTRFSVSANYLDHQGIVRTSEFQRYSLRANVSHEAKSWLTLGTNLNVSRINPRVGLTEGAGVRNAAGVLSAAQSFIPLIPIRREDGQYTWMDRDFPAELANLGVNGTNVENPLGILNETVDRAEYDRFIGNIFADATLTEGMTLRLNGGANIVNNQRSRYNTSLSRRGAQAPGGSAQIGQIEQSHYLGEAILNYRRSFGGMHDLDFTAGTTIETEESFSTDIFNRSFPNDITQFYNIGSGQPSGGPGVSSGFNDWTLLSYLGRVNYGLADKYLLTFTGRADGSSKFGADNKWGFFPSAAFAWRVSEEPFLANADWLSDLKLRVSYGQTGNQEIGTYASLARINNTAYTFGNTTTSGYVVRSIANPELRWEKSEQFDAGFDAAILDNRFTLSLDVYRKLTDDLLLNVPLPFESGFGSALQNLGSVENRGVELALGMDVLEGYGSGLGALGWRTSFNISANRNEVLEIGDREQFFGGTIAGDSKIGGLLVREGEPMGVFYGYRTDGLFRSQAEADAYVNAEGKPILPGAVAGQRRIVDVNGDGRINADDRTILGSAEPDFALGWTNDMTWGNFGLYTFFQGTVGNEVFNANLDELAGAGVGRNMYAPAYLDSWTPDNPDAKWPIINLAPGVGYSFNNPGEIFSHNIEDGSYFRLRNLTFSYDVPESAANRLAGMSSARIFLNAENLFTLTSYSGSNPDVNVQGQNNINRGVDLGAYPFARIFRVGVRFGL
jgi:TonB-linked SusC/RagA family outer membrane protein